LKKFLRVASEGIKKDNTHEISLKWLEFIDSVSVDCESWEESWEEFKKMWDLRN
jgi:hypothetical protein